MSAQTDMVAAVNAAEAAAQQLAAAYVAYTSAYRLASQQVYSATPDARASTAVAELEGNVGPHRIAQFTHGRLIALGAAPVVVQPGAPAPSGPEWVAWLTNQIQHHVP